jgi:hypothetical protein
MRMAKWIAVKVEDEDHNAFIEEAARRRNTERRNVPLSEVVRAELSKSAERFRRKGMR